VAVAVDLLVRERAFENEHERIELAALGLPPRSMKSAPFSYASTGLCTTTRGIPGMIPRTMSSRLGFVAEVMATEVAVAGRGPWSSR